MWQCSSRNAGLASATLKYSLERETWRDTADSGSNLVDSIAVAATGWRRNGGGGWSALLVVCWMALQRSQWREREVAMGAEAA